jgi:hypothetical protein
MKLGMCALLMMSLAAGAAAADKPATKKSKAAPAKAAPAKVQEVVVPAGAVEVQPNIYRFTDPQGKTWIYNKTPFGVSRMEDRAVSVEETQKAQDGTARLIAGTTAVEDGDSIRFERDSPFGRMKWQRKKTELNEVERAAWDRELEKRSARESTENAAAENTPKD